MQDLYPEDLIFVFSDFWMRDCPTVTVFNLLNAGTPAVNAFIQIRSPNMSNNELFVLFSNTYLIMWKKKSEEIYLQA